MRQEIDGLLYDNNKEIELEAPVEALNNDQQRERYEEV